MSDSSLHLTFGVELEFIFVFHQSLLQAHLKSIGEDPECIVKNIPDTVRVAFRPAPGRLLATHPQYHGWGLKSPTHYPRGDVENAFQEWFEKYLDKPGYRGYGGEILHLAQSVLPQGVQVHDSFKQKRTDFASWHLANDTTLLGLDRPSLNAFLDSQSNAFAREDWDSHGIELVTRILPYASPSSMTEIAHHLASLKGPANESATHFATVTHHCGLHVHIGLPRSPSHAPNTSTPVFSLAALQHLAYILVMYEPAISTLFPTSRRAGGAASQTDIASNLGSIYREPTPPAFDDHEAANSGYDAPVSSTSSEGRSPISFAHARSLIFTPTQTGDALVKLMCPSGRDYIVNFTYLTRRDGRARTVEFRQHEGTLAATDVKWWVRFCAELVLLAEGMARAYGVGAEYGGEGYIFQESSKQLSVEDLFAMLGMGVEEKLYWRGRVKMFKPKEPEEREPT